MTEAGKLRIAVIPGDGIGTEVTAEALKVFKAAIGKSDTTEYDLGSRCYLRNGELLTDVSLNSLREHDAILLGAVGDPANIPSGVLERSLLLKIRFALDHHVNLRPSKLFPGVESPLKNLDEINFVVVREGTEGAYTGNGGATHVGTPHKVTNETSISTHFGAKRVVRYTFGLAMARRKKLTLVRRTNVLVRGGGMWQRTVNEVAKKYPGVDVDYSYTDAAAIYLVANPSRFNVIVTDGLFSGIVTDEAGAISGGIGLAASGNIDTSSTNPSMFEPVHGSTPDIADKGVADPTAAILLGAMMLRRLGREQDVQRIKAAVETDIATRGSGPIKTTEVGDRIAATLK